VGHFLNVHEGPHGIGTRIGTPTENLVDSKFIAVAAYNSVPLKAGMTVSNEPGYYADGKYGIRIENIVLVREAKTLNNFGDKGYLGFEHVTMWVKRYPLQTNRLIDSTDRCPMHKKLIDVKLLSEDEKRWVDDYHDETWKKVSPLLKNDTRALEWLKRECAPL